MKTVIDYSIVVYDELHCCHCCLQCLQQHVRSQVEPLFNKHFPSHRTLNISEYFLTMPSLSSLRQKSFLKERNATDGNNLHRSLASHASSLRVACVQTLQ